MRVALFFDGKNFYSGWREAARGRRIDFAKLSKWLMDKVGGTTLWGANYYTSIEECQGPPYSEAQQKLIGFLDMLETQPGFFVYTFKRRCLTINCTECGCENRYLLEKEVDTSLVSHIIYYASINAYDTLILMSGDADYTPALESVRLLGKQAYVASWGGTGMSKRIRCAAFEHVDMMEGLKVFERDLGLENPQENALPEVLQESPVKISPITGDLSMDSFLAELQQAENKFHGGYVGLGYFLTRWRSPHLDTTPDTRREVLDKLLAEGFVETYNAPDGALAIRVSPVEKEQQQPPAPASKRLAINY